MSAIMKTWVLFLCALSSVIYASASELRTNYGVYFRPEFTLRNTVSNWIHTFILPVKELTWDIPDPVPICGAYENVNNDNPLPGCDTVEFAYIMKYMEQSRNRIIDEIRANQHTWQQMLYGSDTGNRRNRRSLSNFISDLTSELFGLCTKREFNSLTEKLSFIQTHITNITGGLTQFNDKLYSYDLALNKRIDNLKSGLLINSYYINSTLRSLSTWESQINDQSNMINRLSYDLGLTKAFLNIATSFNLFELMPLSELKAKSDQLLNGIASLLRNELPITLIRPHVLKEALDDLQAKLLDKYDFIRIENTNLNSYYKTRNTIFTFDDDHIYISIKIPLRSERASRFHVYRVISSPLPTNSTSNTFSEIINLPEFFAVDASENYYIELSHVELATCEGPKSDKQCTAILPLTYRDRKTCASALYSDDSDAIKQYCNTIMFTGISHSKFVHSLDDDSYYITWNEDKFWIESCPHGEPIKIPACQLCVITPKCGCSITSQTFLIEASMHQCTDFNSESVVSYPVNLMILKHFYDYKGNISIYSNTTFTEAPHLPLPDLKVYNDDLDQIVNADNKLTLDMAHTAKLLQDDKVIYSTASAKLTHAAGWLLNAKSPRLLIGVPSMSAIMSAVAVAISGYCLYKISVVTLMISAFMRQPLMSQGAEILSNVVQPAIETTPTRPTAKTDGSPYHLYNALLFLAGASLTVIAVVVFCLFASFIFWKFKENNSRDSVTNRNNEHSIANNSTNLNNVSDIDEYELDEFDY